MRVVKPSDEPEPEGDTPPAAQPTPGTRLPSGFATMRDIISFVAGMVIIVNEVFLSPTVEAYALGVGVALTGLPLVFNADERRVK